MSKSFPKTKPKTKGKKSPQKVKEWCELPINYRECDTDQERFDWLKETVKETRGLIQDAIFMSTKCMNAIQFDLKENRKRLGKLAKKGFKIKALLSRIASMEKSLARKLQG